MPLRIVSSTIGIISIAMSIYTLIRVYIQKKRTQNTIDNMDKVIAEIEEDKAKLADMYKAYAELEKLMEELSVIEDVNPCVLDDVHNFKNGTPLKFYKSNDELLHAVIDYCFTEIKDDSKLDKYAKKIKLCEETNVQPVWVKLNTDMKNYHNGKPLEYYKDEKELLNAVTLYYTGNIKEEEK